MGLPVLRDRAGPGGVVLSAWSSLTDPVVHEALLRAPFDAVLFDMQHGLHDLASVGGAITRAAFLGKPAIVRVPIGELATAGRCLDLGASAIVLPMVESADDARRFASATKYPPVGTRSFGPARAVELHGFESGAAYFAAANAATLALAMIETPSALAALDDILAIAHLDGVFVGPSDLSLALSGNGTLDPTGAGTDEAIRRIAETARTARKLTAIYAASLEEAQRYRAHGYDMTCVSSDLGLLKSAAADLIAAFQA